uniref:IPT/TIG domain-containing protein n=1 Tax=Soboliphyme baturini TaxID=241478 RepID=A0A183IZ10_9BILA
LFHLVAAWHDIDQQHLQALLRSGFERTVFIPLATVSCGQTYVSDVQQFARVETGAFQSTLTADNCTRSIAVPTSILGPFETSDVCFTGASVPVTVLTSTPASFASAMYASGGCSSVRLGLTPAEPSSLPSSQSVSSFWPAYPSSWLPGSSHDLLAPFSGGLLSATSPEIVYSTGSPVTAGPSFLPTMFDYSPTLPSFLPTAPTFRQK